MVQLMTAVAILILDMCGYRQLMAQSRPAANAAVELLQEAATFATERHGGRVVKFWADNVMAAFPTVQQAHAAAEATMALVPSAAGIGWGEVEDRGDDLVGLEVCDACKLGEDEAEEGCVLLTPAAKEEFGPERVGARPEPGRSRE
jgi:class 3 adenylate cyclase